MHFFWIFQRRGGNNNGGPQLISRALALVVVASAALLLMTFYWSNPRETKGLLNEARCVLAHKCLSLAWCVRRGCVFLALRLVSAEAILRNDRIPIFPPSNYKGRRTDHCLVPMLLLQKQRQGALF